MTEYKWKPADDAALEGHVLIRKPTFDERYEYMELAQFEVDEQGRIIPSMKQLGSLRKLVSSSQKHYKEVALKKKEDGSEVKSFEEMTLDSDCDGALVEIASLIMNGFKVSKK